MKKFLLLLLLSTLPAFGQAARQACTLAASGTCNMGNSYGAYGASFEEIPNGSPSGVSVTVQGCMQGGTCDTAADTNTSTSATVRAVTFTKVYDYFKITVGTLTGGTSPTMTINSVVSTANSHSAGGVVTSVFTRTGAVAATSGDYTCAQVTGCIAPTHLLISSTAPTILAAGCGGSGASIVANNGTAAFEVNVGTSNTGACSITLPTATTGWACYATDVTTTSVSVSQTKQSGLGGVTSVTLQNYTDVSATGAWVDSDKLIVSCLGY